MAAVVLVAETALTLAGTGMVFALPDSDTAVSVATSVSGAAQYGPAEAQDATSALLMARLQNRRIEILSERTTDSTTYALPDGNMQTEAYVGPVRVKQDGAWHDIDTSLTDSGDDLKPEVAAADIAVSDGGDTALASVTKSGRSFGLGWEDKLPTPTVRDATASYALGDGQTLTATALAQGFSENITLDQQPAGQSLSYRIPLNLKGLALSQADSGHLLLKDSDGKLVAEAPAPMMWDASKDPASGESAHQEQVATEIETAADGAQTLVLTPDMTFLATATYPVTVDPTTTLAVTTDTWIQTPDYPDSQISSQELKSGTYDGGADKARSYLKFDVSKFVGKHITDTNFALYSYYSSTCATDGSGTTVRRITSTWTSAGLTWAGRPDSTGTGAVNNLVPRGYSSACPAAWSNWDIDAIVQAWADGAPNYGVMVYGTNESDSTTWRRFRSANYTTTGYAPKLTVTYNSYPATPTSAAMSPSAVNTYNGKRYVTSYTPTLSAKVSDPDGSTVKAQFEITNDPAYTGETSYSYTATSASVSSGGTATLAVPSASQLAASHLRMRVRGYDGTDYGAWSSYLYFEPNVAKPTAPTISCDAYPSGVWTDKSSSGATCTLDTSSSDGQGYEWGLDNSAAPNKVSDTTDGIGGDPLTVHITPANGWHTFSAKTIDSGGNLSTSTTSYSFGVGKAGLNSPTTGDTTDDDVTLAATQSGAFTGVTYQYEIGSADPNGWQPIPLSYVTKASDGTAVSSWPLGFAASAQPVDLDWAATGQLNDDGPVQVRALFTDGTNTYATTAATVTIDRKADNAPTADLGPGSVNLLTGDYGLDATDASAFGAAVTRTFSSRDPLGASGQDGQVAIFGPNWISGITATKADWGYIKQTSPSSVAVVDSTGTSTGFTLLNATAGTWTPQPGSESLTLTGTLSGSSFTLKDTDGTTATFTKPNGNSTWQLATSYTITSDSATTTTVTSHAVAVSGGSQYLAEPQYVIAPTSAVSAATCAGAPSTKGCRVLEFAYAPSTTATASTPGDYAGQVQQINLWATAPGASASTATPIAAYDYTSSGQLADTWDPRLSTPLKTSYTYDSAGLVTTLTPPGQLPWTFAYDHVGSNGDAGDGMLVSVSRPTLQAGTTATTDGGTATTNVVYDVPVSGSAAPYDLSSNKTGTWAQTDNPTLGTAVFPPTSVPSSHNGTALGSGAYIKATITYMDERGLDVNTAAPGGHITTTEYDDLGNTTRQLTAANRELALGTTTSTDPLVAGAITSAGSPAEAAGLLSTTTNYTTASDGSSLVSDVLGPLHTITLRHTLPGGASTADLVAGSETLARSHTSIDYDENRPSSAKVSDLMTSVTSGAAVPLYPSDGDKQTTATTYDWTTGLPLTTVTDPSGLAITTTYSYDSDGNQTKEIQPTSSGTDAKTMLTTYYTATGTGSCAGHFDWADLVCTQAPGNTITDGGSNPNQLPTRTYTYDNYGQVKTLTETANGTTRTTTTTYDSIERPQTVTTTGGTGTTTPATTYTYDTTTGAPSTVTSNNQTVTATYDKLGRQMTYNDGTGNTTATSYDSSDRPVSRTDSAPSTTTYTYDTTTGLPTTLTDSVAGAFTAASYDADGNLTGETLPGSYTLTQTYDTTGAPTVRAYADFSKTPVLTDTADYTADGQQAGHTENNGTTTTSTYTYDAADRLTQASDDSGSTCTTRSYGFDGDTSYNRTSLTTAASITDCASTTTATTTATTATHTYDSADRITDTGYTYDAFGRTTALPDGTTLAYYTGDLVRQETTSTTKQTWTLDATHRLAAWTTQTSTDGGTTWATTATRASHYDDGTDSPAWTTEDTSGTITRNVTDLATGLAATTSATGGTTLQLANIHGDIAVQLAMSTTAITALSYDEFGNATGSARYGWLGEAQRSSDAQSGIMLMGLRLYNSGTGRFLSVDPVLGGSANAYDYTNQDPVNQVDLAGTHTAHRTCGYFTCTIYISRKATESLYAYFVRHGWTFAAAAGIIGAIGGGLACDGNYWCLGAFEAWALLWGADIIDATDEAHMDHKCLAIKTTSPTIGFWSHHAFLGYLPLYPEEVGGKNCQKK
ncbi:DNRLRE domain-containing protein [Streptomyces sp. ME02-8801-2C]|uniref:DNRLRE domain-containing protein n=1 Tax=Streptomyces sp. ME02-8801-2C TaxID=3028680 RepID=UPI0029ABE1CC|nr:DNRLRE domain-containing protein [Streptomyces sp. ME02-8801-2C]MDX3458585.1 DNRLRE domain-containing protein [Streptomyces sp. ME02-8801-2C]